MRNGLLLVGLGLVLAAVGISVWAYPILPAQVPTHWDLAGHVNGYSSRLVAVALVPAMAVVIGMLGIVLPAVSPRGFRFDGTATAFHEAMLATIGLLVAIHFLVLRAAITATAPSVGLIFALIGALMVVLGILIGKVPKNFFMGIRTPWTLANDEVWTRTNRLGGRLMILGGVGLTACSPFGYFAAPALLAVVLLAAVIPVVYSYVLYRRIEGFGG
jgi:uncharacterized membrane protein